MTCLEFVIFTFLFFALRKKKIWNCLQRDAQRLTTSCFPCYNPGYLRCFESDVIALISLAVWWAHVIDAALCHFDWIILFCVALWLVEHTFGFQYNVWIELYALPPTHRGMNINNILFFKKDELEITHTVKAQCC